MRALGEAGEWRQGRGQGPPPSESRGGVAKIRVGTTSQLHALNRGCDYVLIGETETVPHLERQVTHRRSRAQKWQSQIQTPSPAPATSRTAAAECGLSTSETETPAPLVPRRQLAGLGPGRRCQQRPAGPRGPQPCAPAAQAVGGAAALSSCAPERRGSDRDTLMERPAAVHPAPEGKSPGRDSLSSQAGSLPQTAPLVLCAAV